jgi:hypothetical protein
VCLTANDDIITLKANDEPDSLTLMFESPNQDRISGGGVGGRWGVDRDGGLGHNVVNAPGCFAPACPCLPCHVAELMRGLRCGVAATRYTFCVFTPLVRPCRVPAPACCRLVFTHAYLLLPTPLCSPTHPPTHPPAHPPTHPDFDLKLMEIDSEHLGIPETEYSSTIRMPAAEYGRIVRDLASIGDQVGVGGGRGGGGEGGGEGGGGGRRLTCSVGGGEGVCECRMTNAG